MLKILRLNPLFYEVWIEGLVYFFAESDPFRNALVHGARADFRKGLGREGNDGRIAGRG